MSGVMASVPCTQYRGITHSFVFTCVHVSAFLSDGHMESRYLQKTYAGREDSIISFHLLPS